MLAHGTFIYPDSAGNGGGDAPEHVYTVKFTNTELWGPETAEPNSVDYFDVWEPVHRPRSHDRSSSMSTHLRSQEEIAARVKALESILIEKGIMTTEASTGWWRSTRTRSAPNWARRWWPGPGPIPNSSSDYSPTPRGLRRHGHRRPAGRGHGRRGEHRHGTQRHRLHAVLVLSLAGARPAAQLVQGPGYRARIVKEPRKVLPEDFDTPFPTRSRYGSGTPARNALLGAPARPAGTDASARPNWPAW